FVKFSQKLGEALGVSQFIIGVTVVALGTSLPEFITSIIATFKGQVSIVLDNVVGSNIANIFLVIGVGAIFAKALKVERDLIDIDIPLLLASQTLFVFFLIDGKITFFEGVMSLFIIIFYIIYTTKHKCAAELELKKKKHPKANKLLLVLGIILSAFFIYIGAKFTVDSIVNLGTILGVGTGVLSITALAIGTSLPELVVTVTAALKKNYEMSLGNIFGSNIFNSALVVGFPALFKNLTVSNVTLTIGLPFLIAATLLVSFSGISKKIHIWEGLMYVLFYVVFIGRLLMMVI
ncbi:sodium:calcium antiporter, partial [Candidatus Woesearchaeota archaeon]